MLIVWLSEDGINLRKILYIVCENQISLSRLLNKQKPKSLWIASYFFLFVCFLVILIYDICNIIIVSNNF